MFINLSNIFILNIEGSDYRCIISLISTNEAIKFYKMLIWLKKRNIIKMGKEILMFGNIEIKKQKFYR